MRPDTARCGIAEVAAGVRFASATRQAIARADDQDRRNDDDREQPEVLFGVVRHDVEAIDEHDGDGDRGWDEAEREPDGDVIGPSLGPCLSGDIRHRQDHPGGDENELDLLHAGMVAGLRRDGATDPRALSTLGAVLSLVGKAAGRRGRIGWRD